LKSAQELLDYSLGEEKLIQKTIESLVAIGCNAVVTGGKVSEIALHYLNKHNILVVYERFAFPVQQLS